MSEELCGIPDGPFDEAYFQGKTEANIRTIFSMVKEIKTDVKTLKDNLTDLDRWKNRTVGMCTVIAFVVPLVVDWLKGLIK